MDNFASWGESAGGWMGVMVGVTGDQSTAFDDSTDPNAGQSSAVKAVIDWFGPTNFASTDQDNTDYPLASGDDLRTQVHNSASSPESAPGREQH